MAIDTPVPLSEECRNCKALATAEHPLIQAGLHRYCVECAPPPLAQRPVAPLTPLTIEAGNVFEIMGRARAALIWAGMPKKAQAMFNRIVGQFGRGEARTYQEAISLMQEYVADGVPYS